MKTLLIAITIVLFSTILRAAELGEYEQKSVGNIEGRIQILGESLEGMSVRARTDKGISVSLNTEVIEGAEYVVLENQGYKEEDRLQIQIVFGHSVMADRDYSLSLPKPVIVETALAEPKNKKRRKKKRKKKRKSMKDNLTDVKSSLPVEPKKEPQQKETPLEDTLVLVDEKVIVNKICALELSIIRGKMLSQAVQQYFASCGKKAVWKVQRRGELIDYRIADNFNVSLPNGTDSLIGELEAWYNINAVYENGRTIFIYE